MLWNITPLDCCLHLSFSHFPTPLLVLQLWKRNLLILFHTQFPLPHLPGSTGKKKSQFFYQQERLRLLTLWELRALAHPLIAWKRRKVVYISVVSVLGNDAILMLFVTWGGWRGSTSRMRGWGIFHWLCRMVRTGLDFWRVLFRLLPSFCSNWLRLFRWSHSTACCQLCWSAVMSWLSKDSGA